MENKKIYVVIEDNGLMWEDYDEEIVGIFTTLEGAENVKTFMEQKRKDYNYNVVEYELDVFEYNLKKYEVL